MNISILLKNILLVILTLVSLNAEGTIENMDCDENYNTCSQNCEALEDGVEQCTEKCNLEYDKCLEAQEEQPVYLD